MDTLLRNCENCGTELKRESFLFGTLVTHPANPKCSGSGWTFPANMKFEELEQLVKEGQAIRVWPSTPGQSASEQGYGKANLSPEEAFLGEVLAELRRARAKFPDPSGSICATGEEYGELCKAYLDEPRDRVRAEAVQLATMAAREALEGDPTLDAYRAKRGAGALWKAKA